MNDARAGLWLRAILLGIKITAIAFVVQFIGDFLTRYPELPTLKRNPAGWFYYWPTILWDHGPYMRDRDFIGSLLVNVLVYSLLAYFVLRLLKMRKTMT